MEEFSRIHNRLKELRLSRDLSAAEVAKCVGISVTYYYDLEKGVKRLNEDLLLQFANLYGVSSDVLMGWNTDELKQLEDVWPEVGKVLRRSGKKPTERERKRIAKIIELAIEDTDEEK